MSSKHNVYDAFLYKYKKFIIALSYTPGFDISYVVDDISKAFNFKVIKLNGPFMLKPDSVFDYDKLNRDITDTLNSDQKNLDIGMPGFYGSGILLYGLNFPPKMLKHQIDIQLHFSTSVNMFIKTNIGPNNQILYTVDDYNKFKDILAENKINKYFNIKTDPSAELNDAVFDKIIDFLEFKVYGKDYELYSTKTSKEKATKPLEPLYNPESVPALEQSAKAEEVAKSREKDMIDLALSISADNIDNDPSYANKKIHTSSYRYKKLAAMLSDSDHYSDTDIDPFIDTELAKLLSA